MNASISFENENTLSKPQYFNKTKLFYIPCFPTWKKNFYENCQDKSRKIK